MEEITLKDLASVKENVAVNENANTIEEVKITDIKPVSETPTEKVDLVSGAMNLLQIDDQLEKFKERFTKDVVVPLHEGMAQLKLDEEIESDSDENIKVDIEESSNSIEEDLEENTSNITFNEVDPINVSFGDEFEDEDNKPKPFRPEVETASEEEIESIRNEFKEAVKEVVCKPKLDLTKFTIKSKPIGISKVLAQPVTKLNVADWVLYHSKQPISISEMSGHEIEKFDMRRIDKVRSRFNVYSEMYRIIFNHIIDPNKPDKMEEWLKKIKFFDNSHLFFAIYKACFCNANYVPYECPKCGKAYMETIDIDDMVKFATEEVKTEFYSYLNNRDITSDEEVESVLVAVNDKYVIGIKSPSIYNVIFEMAVLDQGITEKYFDFLSIISFIDEIYLVDEVNYELLPISYNPDPNDFVKTVKRKIKAYYEILKQFNSDEYYNIQGQTKAFNNKAETITYVLPKSECKYCKHEIEEREMTPEEMLFIRHRLAIVANT